MSDTKISDTAQKGNFVSVSQNLEWSGMLSRSAGKGAVFSLYLAIYNQPGAEPLKLDEEENNQPLAANQTNTPTNFYRRAPLSPGKDDITRLSATATLLSRGHVTSLALWQAMHPDPLSLKNDPTLIPDDVQANCSYATQQKLRQYQQSSIKTDATLLADIVEQAPQMLHG